MDKRLAVLGLFQNKYEAERAVAMLRLSEFKNSEISIVYSDSPFSTIGYEKESKAPEGATAGASTGAAIGGILGWLAGIGALAIPGIGPLIAAGPLMGLLAGVGFGGTLGGIAGALIGSGIPEYEAKKYETEIKAGGVLLAVHCADRDSAATARSVLESTGATDISQTTEARSHRDNEMRRVAGL